MRVKKMILMLGYGEGNEHGVLVKELGYGCIVDVSQCKEVLSLFLPLIDNMLSKLLGVHGS